MEFADSTVFVTGGAGFIGSHVTHALVNRGTDVYIADDYSAGNPRHVPNGATISEVDIRTPEFEEFLMKTNPDGIIHLAAIHHIPYCNQNPEEAFNVNVMGTRTVLETARKLDALSAFVFASTAAVYPPRTEPHTESDPVEPMDIYGRTKLIGEDLLYTFAKETGVSATAARLFNVYGTNETNMHLIPAILEQLATGTREVELGNLSPKRDFIHVSDVTDGLLRLLSDFDGTYRAYNLGTGDAYSVREVVDLFGRALDDEITIHQDDDRVRESDRPHLQADPSRLRSELGWEPEVAFIDGLRTLLQNEGFAVSEGDRTTE